MDKRTDGLHSFEEKHENFEISIERLEIIV